MGQVWSFSRLGSYDWCARQYYYKYIAKIPEKPNLAMRVGLAFHKFAETFHKEVELDKLEDQGASYIRGFKANHRYVDRFIETEAVRYEKLLELEMTERWMPKMIEKSLTGEIAGVKMRGVVDRVDLLTTGELCVIDYKPKNKASNISKLRRQLVLYRELAEAAYDLEIPQIGAYFYKTGEILLEPGKKRTVTALNNYVTRMLDKIEKDDEYKMKENIDYCGKCSFYKLCFGRDHIDNI
jgi:RecB family exonuclease